MVYRVVESISGLVSLEAFLVCWTNSFGSLAESTWSMLNPERLLKNDSSEGMTVEVEGY